MTAARVAALVAAAAAVGCASADPCDGVSGACLGITVTSKTVARVDTLVLHASGAFSGTQSSSHAAASLPVRVAAHIPADAAGDVTIGVDALLGGAIVGRGEGTTTLAAGKHATLTIALAGASGGLDGGGGDGGGDDGAVDLGDGGAPPDLGRATLSFATKGTYTVGDNPIAVALGNFQAKGNVDIITANFGTADVTWLLQDASGDYPATPQTQAVGISVGGVGVGRWFNVATRQGFIASDGRMGYILMNNSGSSPPTFTAASGTPSGFGDGLKPIAVADFDKMKGDDVAIGMNSNGTGPAVAILLCNGSGNFAASPATYLTGEIPTHLAVADLAGSGNLDLLVSKGTSHLGVLHGGGDGSFATPIEDHTVGTNPQFIAVADFNGDGKPDVAVANAGGSVSILLNDGAGNLPATATPVSAGTSPLGIAAADFDGDGAADLAVTNSNSNTVSILLGDGTGKFAAPVPVTVGGSPSSVAAGDLNADVKPDLVVANQKDGNVTVLLNTSH